MLSSQWDVDVQRVIHWILKHEEKNDIISVYKKGPPKDQGFMWWQDPIVEMVGQKILQMGYDSSAYALMQRKVQHKILSTEYSGSQ